MNDFNVGAATRGPFGTNEGDRWGHPDDDNPIQQRLNADGEGLVLVTEVMRREGLLEAAVYTTRDEELVASAKAGYERMAAQRASEN
jgi:hypothetical protein